MTARIEARRLSGEDLPRPASCGARICTTDSYGPHEHVGGETRFLAPSDLVTVTGRGQS